MKVFTCNKLEFDSLNVLNKLGSGALANPKSWAWVNIMYHFHQNFLPRYGPSQTKVSQHACLPYHQLEGW